MSVCSTEYVYHTLLNPGENNIDSFLKLGLRPLSDFPDSERWQQFQTHMPGFFERLYQDIAYPILQRPYINSGVFVSPIDFRQLPDSLMYAKPRIRLPVSRIDPSYAVLTYVLDEQRVALPLTTEALHATATLWTAHRVTKWFARDKSRLFFYVPQIAAYQPGGLSVEPDDVEQFI